MNIDQPPDHQKAYAKKLERRARRLTQRYTDDIIMGRFTKKLGRAIPDMFRFVIDPRIPPTNNLAEQSLREYVICRIRGCIRSHKTMKRRGDLHTCITPWKNRGRDYLQEIIRYV